VTDESYRGTDVRELRAAPRMVTAAHVHPGHWETLTVVSGTLGAQVGARKTVLRSGQTLGIAPRVAHAWWNAGDDELVLRCELSPAARLASSPDRKLDRLVLRPA
jgi:quercetin dioxygenase-like cupin family protein